MNNHPFIVLLIDCFITIVQVRRKEEQQQQQAVALAEAATPAASSAAVVVVEEEKRLNGKKRFRICGPTQGCLFVLD